MNYTRYIFHALLLLSVVNAEATVLEKTQTFVAEVGQKIVAAKDAIIGKTKEVLTPEAPTMMQKIKGKISGIKFPTLKGIKDSFTIKNFNENFKNLTKGIKNNPGKTAAIVAAAAATVVAIVMVVKKCKAKKQVV